SPASQPKPAAKKLPTNSPPAPAKPSTSASLTSPKKTAPNQNARRVPLAPPVLLRHLTQIQKQTLTKPVPPKQHHPLLTTTSSSFTAAFSIPQAIRSPPLTFSCSPGFPGTSLPPTASQSLRLKPRPLEISRFNSVNPRTTRAKARYPVDGRKPQSWPS